MDEKGEKGGEEDKEERKTALPKKGYFFFQKDNFSLFSIIFRFSLYRRRESQHNFSLFM